MRNNPKMKSLRSLYLIYFISCILYSSRHVFADQIFHTQFGGSGRSSREPQYTIEFHLEDSHFRPDEDQESVTMTNKDGEKYLCFLPKVEKSNSGNHFHEKNTSSMIMETEKRVQLKTPDELLEVLQGQCFARQEGWWTYEFCFQGKMRQFHLEENKVVEEYVLGIYDADATAEFNQKRSDSSILKDPRSKDASQRYHAHQFTNGTICDLTSQPRETEVRFVCSEPRVMISSVTELLTCKYAVTIHSPPLCKHPLFQEERPVWHTINCKKLPKSNKETEVQEEILENKQIIMVTENEHERSSIDDSEESL